MIPTLLVQLRPLDEGHSSTSKTCHRQTTKGSRSRCTVDRQRKRFAQSKIANKSPNVAFFCGAMDKPSERDPPDHDGGHFCALDLGSNLLTPQRDSIVVEFGWYVRMDLFCR